MQSRIVVSVLLLFLQHALAEVSEVRLRIGFKFQVMMESQKHRASSRAQKRGITELFTLSDGFEGKIDFFCVVSFESTPMPLIAAGSIDYSFILTRGLLPTSKCFCIACNRAKKICLSAKKLHFCQPASNFSHVSSSIHLLARSLTCLLPQ